MNEYAENLARIVINRNEGRERRIEAIVSLINYAHHEAFWDGIPPQRCRKFMEIALNESEDVELRTLILNYLGGLASMYSVEACEKEIRENADKILDMCLGEKDKDFRLSALNTLLSVVPDELCDLLTEERKEIITGWVKNTKGDKEFREEIVLFLINLANHSEECEDKLRNSLKFKHVSFLMYLSKKGNRRSTWLLDELSYIDIVEDIEPLLNYLHHIVDDASVEDDAKIEYLYLHNPKATSDDELKKYVKRIRKERNYQIAAYYIKGIYDGMEFYSQEGKREACRFLLNLALGKERLSMNWKNTKYARRYTARLLSIGYGKKLKLCADDEIKKMVEKLKRVKDSDISDYASEISL